MRNPFRRGCPPDVMAALLALDPGRAGAAWNYWDDMLLYAHVGRDRHKLDMAWVSNVARNMERWT